MHLIQFTQINLFEIGKKKCKPYVILSHSLVAPSSRPACCGVIKVQNNAQCVIKRIIIMLGTRSLCQYSFPRTQKGKRFGFYSLKNSEELSRSYKKFPISFPFSHLIFVIPCPQKWQVMCWLMFFLKFFFLLDFFSFIIQVGEGLGSE